MVHSFISALGTCTSELKKTPAEWMMFTNVKRKQDRDMEGLKRNQEWHQEGAGCSDSTLSTQLRYIREAMVSAFGTVKEKKTQGFPFHDKEQHLL